MRKKWREPHEDVGDKIYDILASRKDGISLQSLARMLDLKIGTVQKNLERMGKDLLVIRTIHNGTFVYKLTDENNIVELWKK